MSLMSIANMANSLSLRARVVACAATQDLGGFPTEAWVQGNILQIVSQPGWTDAWNEAEANKTLDVNPDTGARPGVISDAMIIAAVQAVIAAQAAAAQTAAATA